MGNICKSEKEQKNQKSKYYKKTDEIVRFEKTQNNKLQHSSDYFLSSQENVKSYNQSTLYNSGEQYDQQNGSQNLYAVYEQGQYEDDFTEKDFLSFTQNETADSNSKQSFQEYQNSREQRHSVDTVYQSFSQNQDNQQQYIFSEDNLDTQNQNQQQQQILQDDLEWGSSVLDEEKLQICIKNFEEKPDQDKSWKLAQKKNGIYKIYKKSVKNSAAILIRSEFTIQNNLVQNVFDNFHKIEQRTQWDTLIRDIQQIKKINEFTDIYYYIVDPSKTISNRDWLMRRFYKKDFPFKGDITLIEYSIEHKDMPQFDGMVRAEAKFVGYMLRQVEKDVEVCIVSDNDIKGNIPSWVVNSFADKGTRDWITQLIKICQQQQQQQQQL